MLLPYEGFISKSLNSSRKYTRYAFGEGDATQMKPILVVLIAVSCIGSAALSGCLTPNPNADVNPITKIKQQEAVRIFVDQILKPGASTTNSSALMLTRVLRPGDVITSESGTSYPVSANSWFVFIDDAPWALYAHPTRYLLIDAETGVTTTINESWPPLINNHSLGDNRSHHRGDLITVYPTLSYPLPIPVATSPGAPRADYGDAPDGQEAYVGVTGAFPTYYNTTHSRVGDHCAHAVTTGQEMLGTTVSAEVDVTDPNDPDLVPNLVNADSDDGMAIILSNHTARLSVTITVNATAPDVPRYLNALIDFDQNGSWMEGAEGTEWTVINEVVNVTPGTTTTYTTLPFRWGVTTLPSPVWMRVSLTRETINETMFAGVGGWDGIDQKTVQEWILLGDPSLMIGGYS